ncbi:MAG: DUF4388 domain-containing protein [Deltaproteobacteria bacterium]|nr:DUF4388 domain-containing protein [Deltaproteobacteria bacterium]
MHVSKNRLEGSLADTRLDKLLEKLELHLFTGTIELKAAAGSGAVDLRAGAVESVRLGTLEGEAAMKQARALDQGEYVVVQRVPDLTGALGSSAGLEGEVGDVPIAAIMRHCESHALTCSLIVVDGFDRGEIHYRAGDLDFVSLNGVRDEDAILTIVGWKAARFKVALPPLDLDIAGWPQVGPEPTQPFRISKMPPPKKRAASVPSIVEGVPNARAAGAMGSSAGQETVPVSLPEPVKAAVRAASLPPKAGAGSVSGTASGTGQTTALPDAAPAPVSAAPSIVVASSSSGARRATGSSAAATAATAGAAAAGAVAAAASSAAASSAASSSAASAPPAVPASAARSSNTGGAQRLASVPPSTLPGLATPSRLGDLLFVLLILVAFGVAAFLLDAR